MSIVYQLIFKDESIFKMRMDVSEPDDVEITCSFRHRQAEQFEPRATRLQPCGQHAQCVVNASYFLEVGALAILPVGICCSTVL